MIIKFAWLLLLLTIGTYAGNLMNKATFLNEPSKKEKSDVQLERYISAYSIVDKQSSVYDKDHSNIVNQPLDVPLILQKPELMRGCEVTSLAMLLHYHGIPVDKMELANNIQYEPFKENGIFGNMHEGFVGDMRTFDNLGLGVFVEPIIELVKMYIPENRVINLSGKEPADLYEVIDKGLPVWVLTNALFKELPDDQFPTWNTDVGDMNVTYQQHSVVITGYDNLYVYINDPLKTYKNRAIERNDFEKAWMQMGREAMNISYSFSK